MRPTIEAMIAGLLSGTFNEGQVIGWLTQIESDLAAAKAALAQVQLDRAEFAALKAKLALAKEAIRATAGLQRIAETERDQYKAKLAKYERAKMPPEPERLTMTRKLALGGVATETVVAAHKYDELRTLTASQTVRADENERNAKRLGKLYEAARLLSVAWEIKPPLAWQPDGHQSLLAALRRAIADATIKDQP